MKIPTNPIPDYRRNRLVRKVKSQYTYSIDSFIKRNKPDKSREDSFLIGGLIIYVGAPILGAIFNKPILTALSGIIFLIVVLIPIFLKFVDEVSLSRLTTVTMDIVANNPEKVRPRPCLLIGCEFGTALESTEKLNEFITLNKTKFRKHLFPILNLPEIVKGINKEQAEKALTMCENNGWKIYPVLARGNNVPFLWALPDVPEKCLRATRGVVRAGWGQYKVRYAHIYALECSPIDTSLEIKGVIVDVQIALFIPFFTTQALETWLQTTAWFLPTKELVQFATFVKRETDHHQTEKLFRVLEEERNSATESYDRLLTQKQLEEIKDDNEKSVMRNMPRIRNTQLDVTGLAIVAGLAFVIGWIIRGLFP